MILKNLDTGSIYSGSARQICHIMQHLIRHANFYGLSFTLEIPDKQMRNVYHQYSFCAAYGFKLNCSSKYNY